MDRIAQPLKAPSDRNGNPCEVVIVYDLTPGYPVVVVVIDVGFMSTQGALEMMGHGDVVTLPLVYTSAQEYAGWMRHPTAVEA